MAVSTNRLVSFVQQELNARYGLKLTVDGKVGPNTMQALNRVTAIPSQFENGKRFIAFIQYLTHVEPLVEDIAIDGYIGPATENAMNQLLSVDRTGKPDLWRDDMESSPKPFAHFDRIRATRDESGVKWPEESDLGKFYGAPGTNWVKMQLPFSMKLAWDTSKSISRFSINAKVKPHAEQMFEEVLDVYGISEIRRLRLDLWAGCAVVRKIRGGSRYSSHSYGCSIDIDSANNRLKWKKEQSSLALPEYEDFWKCVYRNGGRSLGIEHNYDFMHFGWYNYK